jgi:ribosome maturation factor RimP
MIDLTGKMVTVETAETTYTGKLVEIGEEEVYLESETGWIVIPVDKIASIREKE